MKFQLKNIVAVLVMALALTSCSNDSEDDETTNM